MKKNNIILIVIILCVLLLASIFLLFRLRERRHVISLHATNPHMDQEKKVDPNNKKVTGKFSESAYAQICWEVAPVDPISDEAKLALYGIAIRKERQTDGSINVFLRPDSPRYPWKEMTVQNGYSLYFCDKTDDDEEIGMTDTDVNSNGDDFPLLVDPQGNIVPGQQVPSPFQ